MYTVLHIEKSELFCAMVRDVLNKRGYDYMSTGSFNEAYGLMKEQNVDLIITSLYANGGTIENFVRDVNESEKKDVPIFVVTGNSMDDKKKDLMNMGISDYITKENLQEEITKHLDAVFQEDKYMKDLREANIAIIDDSKLECIIEKTILKKYRITNVDCYSSAKELLDSKKKYDMYLVDIILKNEFGKNLIRHIRRDNINSSIIAVTGLNNVKTLSSIMDAGADDYITKPIDEMIFIQKLKSNIKVYSLNKQMKSMLKEMER